MLLKCVRMCQHLCGRVMVESSGALQARIRTRCAWRPEKTLPPLLRLSGLSGNPILRLRALAWEAGLGMLRDSRSPSLSQLCSGKCRARGHVALGHHPLSSAGRAPPLPYAARAGILANVFFRSASAWGCPAGGAVGRSPNSPLPGARSARYLLSRMERGFRAVLGCEARLPRAQPLLCVGCLVAARAARLKNFICGFCPSFWPQNCFPPPLATAHAPSRTRACALTSAWDHCVITYAWL